MVTLAVAGRQDIAETPRRQGCEQLPRNSLFTWAVRSQVFVLLLNLNAKNNHQVRSSPKVTTVHLRQDKHPAHVQVGPPSQAL